MSPSDDFRGHGMDLSCIPDVGMSARPRDRRNCAGVGNEEDPQAVAARLSLVAGHGTGAQSFMVARDRHPCAAPTSGVLAAPVLQWQGGSS